MEHKKSISRRIASLIARGWAWSALPVMLLTACTEQVKNPILLPAQPSIYPDYKGVTIPVGIAPLNFNMVSARQDIDKVDVVVRGSKGGELHTQGELAQFDIDDWHELVALNQGGELTVTVCEKIRGKWSQYQDFTIHVSPYPLDEWGLTYRRIAPGYEVYSHMGLFQRDLSNFTEKAIFENTQVPGACVNCHKSNRTNPEQFVFHIRGDHGATLIQQHGQHELLKASNDSIGGTMVYPYWHPSGKYCAFSTNQTRQGFHSVDRKRIEVFDLSSDVLVYCPETHEILLDTLLKTKDWSENIPTFSPDGKWIYFTTCKQQVYPEGCKLEQYNLCRIAFDADNGTFGDRVDTLFNAVAMGKSVTWPCPSYDGKYILFTLQDYGYFSVWHPESEQWVLDLQTMEARPIEEINSRRADSFHNWSANSHWIVFTSRRGDGLYTRLYIASVDDDGHFGKPFLLPQKNPWKYYDESIYSYNTPDFTAKPVQLDARAAGSGLMSDLRTETRVR